MTGADMVNAVLRRIGTLGQGQVANGSEATETMVVWNGMFDTWNTDPLNTPSVPEIPLNLNANQQTYEIGPGGADFNRVRPIRIQAANAVLGDGTHWPLDLIGANQWNAIVQRSISGTVPFQLFAEYGLGQSKLDAARWMAILGSSAFAQVPWQLYFDGGFPKGKLNFFPKPAYGMTLNLAGVIGMATPVLTDTLAFSPGTLEAIRTNLALKCCEEWGMPVPPSLPGEAGQALNAMRAVNAQWLAPQGTQTSPPPDSSAGPQRSVPPPPAPQQQQQ